MFEDVRGNTGFVSCDFFHGREKSSISVPSTGRKVNERVSTSPPVSREMIIRDTSTRCSTFHSEYLLGETALNSVTRTSLELNRYTTEGVNTRHTHTRAILKKEKKTLRKSIR